MDDYSSDHCLQGTIMSEEISRGVLDSSLSISSASSSECMLEAAACSSRALMERRLRPPQSQSHDQNNLKCPRCDSSHTKFCYYNNYSLSQPRYFCKTCRRYWTKGGTLRNIPVGGGCRKNKRSSTSNKSNNHPQINQPINGSIMGLGSPSNTCNNPNPNPIDVHPLLSFPHELQFPPHLANLGLMGLGGGTFMEAAGGMIRPIDFMENTIINGSEHCGFFGGIGAGYNTANFGTIYSCNNSPFGLASTNNNDIHDHENSAGISAFMDERLLLPYDDDHDHDENGVDHVKPNPKVLSLEWSRSCATTSDHNYNNNTNNVGIDQGHIF